MNSQERYRDTLGELTPSPAWREATLAAMKEAQGKKARLRRRPLAFAATAAALALAVTGGIWWTGRMEADPDGPGVARTPEPVVTPTPTSAIPQDDPRWNDTFSIVTDPSQLMGNNPIAGRMEEPLFPLPLYENAVSDQWEQERLLNQWLTSIGLTLSDTQWTEGSREDGINRLSRLEGTCTDGTQVRMDGAYCITLSNSPDPESLEQAAVNRLVSICSATPEVRQETLTTYDFTGEPHTTRTSYLYYPEAALEENLICYSFYRVSAVDGRVVITLRVDLSADSYPLRPAEDAVASFHAGDYWGSDYTAHPEQAEILQVTLEYDTTAGQPYFQPVYRILFTQDYWDEVIADWMFDGVDPSPYMGVGVAYVPAIEPEYQNEVPYRRYFNDGLAHFTPEDFP